MYAASQQGLSGVRVGIVKHLLNAVILVVFADELCRSAQRRDGAEHALVGLVAKRHRAPAFPAFARTGYHRGLDRLRANGWKGWGPVPFSHEPNQGVLRAIAALALASKAIGDDAEYDRCRQMLSDADPGSVDKLLG